MSWRKNTRDQFADSRYHCSRWHDTDFERINRIPRRVKTTRVHWAAIMAYVFAGICLAAAIGAAIKGALA
jgi:hypothetical protein